MTKKHLFLITLLTILQALVCSIPVQAQCPPNTPCSIPYCQVVATPFCVGGQCIGSDWYEEFGQYALVFSDYFEGNTLNTQFWLTKYPYAEPWDLLHHPNEQQLYLDDNVNVVNDGMYDTDGLNLQILNEPNTPYPNLPFSTDSQFDRDYTSGMVFNNKDQPGLDHPSGCFKYGKFVFLAKMPAGQALWPALWLHGWGEEMDLLEMNTDCQHEVMTNMHRALGSGSMSINDFCNGFFTTDVDLSEDFHEYTLEWTPYRVDYIFDGEIKRTFFRYYDPITHQGLNYADIPKTPGAQILESRVFPTGEKWHDIIINLAKGWGGACAVGNNGNPSNTTPCCPSTMVVRSVEVYQKVPKITLSTNTICSGQNTEVQFFAGEALSVWGVPTGISWEVSPNISIVNNTGNIITVTGTPGSINLPEQGWIKAHYNNPNSCFDNDLLAKVTVNKTPAIPMVSASSFPCFDKLVITNYDPTLTYTWSISINGVPFYQGPGNAPGGNGMIIYSPTNQPYMITYKLLASNSCGSPYITGQHEHRQNCGGLPMVGVFPNPANDVLNIRLSNTEVPTTDRTGIPEEMELLLINELGQVHKVIRTAEPEIQIPTADLPNGFYYAILRTATTKILSEKFLVQHGK